MQANEAHVLPEKISDQLSEILGWVFQDPSGPPEALLTEDEYRLLTIPKGSLNELERREIESHVEHSYRILSQIPWTRELRRVPEMPERTTKSWTAAATLPHEERANPISIQNHDHL